MRNARLSILIFLLLLPQIVTAQANARNHPPPVSKTRPPFALRQQNGVWWLVAPDGKPFFSRGVCCITPGDTWLEYKPQNPGYAAWQNYSDTTAWATATVERLKAWNMTTIGGWSDFDTLKRAPQMALYDTPVLHIGSSAGLPWLDMWDPKNIRVMEEVAAKQIVPIRDDPRVLGYYADNELGWWNATLFQFTLDQPPKSGQRRRLIQLLRRRYQDNWRRLRKDFVPEKVDSFDALAKGGKLYLRPGGEGIQAIKAFVSLLADRYYALTKQVIRKYDSRGLYLGDRYQSFYYPEVAGAARKYVDVISTNLNASWLDGTITRFYLETLHALTDKPVLVSEFYMAAKENRSGNKNDSSGFPVVATQQERAANFRNTLETLAKTPYVVGADWFQYFDEPTLGRGDGENYDMGLVDIHDAPYTELTSASAALDSNRLHAEPAPRRNVLGGVPPAPADPAAGWKTMEALQNWDRERGFVPPSSRNPVADLYLCWDARAVYVGLYAMDIVEANYYRDKRIPDVDRAELVLRIGRQGSPIRIRLGAGRKPGVTGAAASVVNLSGLEHDVRNIAVVTLPAALFGKPQLHAGDRIDLMATLKTHARAYHVDWAGTYRLAE